MADILVAGGGIVTAGGGIAFAAVDIEPPAEVAPSDIVFSAMTVPYDAEEDVVLCTLSAPGATEPVTFSVVGGSDAALVYVDGHSIKRSGSGSLTPDDVLDIDVRADNGVGSPYDETWSPTVYDPAAEVPLMTMTMSKPSGTFSTAQPFAIPLPFSPDALGDGDVIHVYDDDGSGGKGSLLSAYQATDPSTDLNDKLRMVLLSGVAPSAGSLSHRKLFVAKSQAAAPTGTAITAANIAATSFECVVEFDIEGTVYTFDVRDALAASETFSKTGYSCVVRSSGPFCTRIYVAGPPRSSGDTAHASGDGLRVECEVVAWKASSAAVGGGNPIITVEVDPWVQNGAVDRVSPAHHYYGYRISRSTSLSDGTLIHTDGTDADGNLIRYDYPREASPAGDLSFVGSAMGHTNQSGFTRVDGTSGTISGNQATRFFVGRRVRAVGSSTGTIYGRVAAVSYSSPNTSVTFAWDSGSMASETITLAYSSGNLIVDRSSGTWPTDILGAHILGLGTDMEGVVVARTSGTRISVYQYVKKAPCASAATVTSGSWSIEGIGHHYSTVVPPRRVTVGAKRDHVLIWGDVSSAVSATERAPMNVVSNSQLLPNYQTSYASVNHTGGVNELNLVRASDGSRRPLTILGGETVNIGEVETDIGKAGWDTNLGMIPEHSLVSLVKWTPEGRRRLYENAEYFSFWQYGVPARLSGTPAAGELGVPPRADGGVEYAWNEAYGSSTTIPVTNKQWFPFDSDTAHHSAPFYIAYLTTGSLYWIKAMERNATYSTQVSQNKNYNGDGINKTRYGDALGLNSTHLGNSQSRGRIWGTRDLLYQCTCTPDTLSGKIAQPKDYLKTRVEKHWSAAKKYTVDNVLNMYPTDGTPLSWLRQNKDTSLWAGGTPSPLPTPGQDAPWQMSFNMFGVGMAGELGLLDENGNAFLNWLVNGLLQMSRLEGVYRDIMPVAYSQLIVDGNRYAANPGSWEEVYKRTAHAAPVNTNGRIEQVARSVERGGLSGTVTISNASVGTGRTFTFSQALFAAGDWYIGGYINEDAPTLAVAEITAVNSAYEVVANITHPFTSTAPSINNIRVPGFAPSDYDNSRTNVSGSDYPQYYVAGLRISAVDRDVHRADAEAAIAYHISRPGYTEYRPTFYIAPRS